MENFDAGDLQVCDILTYRRKTTPEKKLLVAMLERAILDLEHSNPARRIEAEAWIFCEVDQEHQWSFSWCCDHLEFDAGRVKERLRSYIVIRNRTVYTRERSRLGFAERMAG